MSPTAARVLRYLCLTVSAAAFIVAGAMMIFGADKSNGIFAVLFAAILARVLVIDIAGWLEQKAIVETSESSSQDVD